MVYYPSLIDTNATLPPIVDGQPVSASISEKLRTTIIAIEAELGVKPSGTAATVRARLDALDTYLLNFHPIVLTNDLGGTYASPKVVGIQGRPVSTVAPTIGQALVWNGIAWIPRDVGSGGGGGGGGPVAISGDVTGTLSSSTVQRIQSRQIAPTAPVDGYVLTWDAADNMWEPKITPGGALPGGGGTLSSQGNWAGNRAVNQTLPLHATSSVGIGNILWVCAQDPDYLYGKNGACIFSLDISVTPAKMGKVISGVFGPTAQPTKITYGDGHLWVVGYDDFSNQTYSTCFCYKINPNTGEVVTAVLGVPDCQDIAYDGYNTIAVLGNDPFNSNCGRITLLNSATPVFSGSNYIQTGTGFTSGNLNFRNCYQLATGGLAGQFWTISINTEIVGTGLGGAYIAQIQSGLVTNSFSATPYNILTGAIGYDPITDYIYFGADHYIVSYGPMSSPSDSFYSWNNSIIRTIRMDVNNNKLYALSSLGVSSLGVGANISIDSYDISTGPVSINVNTGGSRIWTHRDLPGIGVGYTIALGIAAGTPCAIDYNDIVLRKFTPVISLGIETFDNFQDVGPLSDYRILDLSMFNMNNPPAGFLKLQQLGTGNQPYARNLYTLQSENISLINDVSYRLPVTNQRSGQGEGSMRIGGAKVVTSGARLETGKTLTTVAGTIPDCIISDINAAPYNKMYVSRIGSKDVIGTDFVNNNQSEYESLRDQVYPLFDRVDGYTTPAYPNETVYPIAIVKPSTYPDPGLIAIDNNGGAYGIRSDQGSVTSYPGYFAYGMISPLPNCLFRTNNNVLYTATTDNLVAIYFNALSAPTSFQDNYTYPYTSLGAFSAGFSFSGNFKCFLYTEFPIFPSQGRFMWVGTDNGDILIQNDVYYYETNQLQVQFTVGSGKTVSAIKQDGYVVYASNREDGFIVMIDPTNLYGTPTMTSGTNLHSGKLIDFCFAQGQGWALFDNQNGTGSLIPFDLTPGPGFLTALNSAGYTIPDIPRHCTKGYQLNKDNHYVYVTAGDKVYQCDAITTNGTPVKFPVGGLVDWV